MNPTVRDPLAPAPGRRYEATGFPAGSCPHHGPGTISRRVVSYGGGVQSNALLVLAAQGRIDYRTFLFANVGDDSEHPATLRYVRGVAMPYAAAHGIALDQAAAELGACFDQVRRLGIRAYLDHTQDCPSPAASATAPAPVHNEEPWT
jgi:hypothetical protein